MSRPAPRSSPRPRSLRSGAFFIACLAACVLAGAAPGPAAAQEEDTLPRLDTARAPQRPAAPQDTAAADTAPPPPALLPALAPLGPAGWVRGVWEWGREDLQRMPDVTVLDLLERIPGVVPVRADIVNQPEAAAVFGAAAGAVRWVVDGFELDPLTSPSFDPAGVSLLALERVRIERRVTGATVYLETLAPDDGRVKSVIEAGTGDYGANLFRGIFLAPRLLGGAMGAGFERLSANGYRSGGGSNHNETWLKWTWAGAASGVRLEYRQSRMERSGVGSGTLRVRSDWAVRARGTVGPVTGEAYVGASAVEDDVGGVAVDTLYREGSPQGGFRVATAMGEAVPVAARAALRFRDHPALPGRELELAARATPTTWLAVEGDVIQGWWAAGAPTGRGSGRLVAGPVLGLEAFGEVFRGAPVAGGGGAGSELRTTAPADSLSARITRAGARAGARWQWGGLALGAAAVSFSADTLLPFGAESEPAWVGLPGGAVRGFEATARIPTGLDPFYLEGWYVGMREPQGWFYLPEHHWRAALVYHHLPLESGNLELFARLEHAFRGRMTVPAAPGGEAPVQEVGSNRGTYFELVIRVLTVRAFLRWDNIMHRRDQNDLPGLIMPGQHIFWGVKWEFWN